MKKSFILKQLAVAMTAAGEIGADSNLAFKGGRDMGEFAKFSANTAMIIGFDTAQQMADSGVQATAERPWVVISRGRFVNHLDEKFGNHVYYVSSLEGALALATNLAECNAELVGYTICGGLRIYEDAIKMMQAKTLCLNSVYIHEGEADPTDPTVLNKKLSVDFAGFMKLLDSNMITRKVTGFDAAVRVRNISKVEHRMNGKFRWVYDAEEYDPSAVEVINRSSGKLFVTLTNGDVQAIDMFAMTAYRVGTATESIEVQTNYGKIDVRPKGKRAGVNALEIAIRKNWV